MPSTGSAAERLADIVTVCEAVNSTMRNLVVTVLWVMLGSTMGACDRTESMKQPTSEVASAATMTDEDFWRLVSLLDWKKAGNDKAVVAPLVNALAMRSVDDIQAFEDTLAEKLFALDGEAFARNIGKASYVSKDVFFSVDNFLYARCAAVANGAEYFNRVLNDPTRMPKDLWFEAILSVAADAYRVKTGRKFEYSPKVDYETYANKAGWR